MKFDKEAWEPLNVDMTPMVDCIFAIILFLLVVASFVENMEQDVSIELPTASVQVDTKAPPTPPIVVNVRLLEGGRALYIVQSEQMTLQQLKNNLSLARATKRDQSVVIRGDRNVRWEHIADVLITCGEVGITKVYARTEYRENG